MLGVMRVVVMVVQWVGEWAVYWAASMDVILAGKMDAWLVYCWAGPWGVQRVELLVHYWDDSRVGKSVVKTDELSAVMWGG